MAFTCRLWDEGWSRPSEPACPGTTTCQQQAAVRGVVYLRRVESLSNDLGQGKLM